jgi:chemotaxis protein MotB
VPKKRKDDSPSGAPEWMCTFSDMMSLLLCFFVLLFSMSTIEKVKFQQAIGSIQGALGRIPTFFNTSYIEPLSVEPQKVEPLQRTKTLQRAKEAIAQKARNKLTAEERTKEVVVEGVDEGIRFSISGRILFQSGSALLSEEGQNALLHVAETLNDFDNLRVRIEGHTDTNPVPAGSPLGDNWRLAEARAYAVLLFFRDKGGIRQERLSFMSCGPYRPRFPNDTEENRALNRRVEIVLLQGHNSEVITGELQGSKEPSINLDKDQFLPNIRREN